MRITVGRSDFTFRIVRPASPSKACTEIEVAIGDQELTLVRKGHGWVSRNPAGEELDAIAEAIGKAIALRYRI